METIEKGGALSKHSVAASNSLVIIKVERQYMGTDEHTVQNYSYSTD